MKAFSSLKWFLLHGEHVGLACWVRMLVERVLNSSKRFGRHSAAMYGILLHSFTFGSILHVASIDETPEIAMQTWHPWLVTLGVFRNKIS